jgi:hypothetical protein
MHAYERHAYEIVSVRNMPMRNVPTYFSKNYHSRKRLLGKPASPTIFLPVIASDKEDL